MGRELLISLGITILTAAALFLYFRNRFKIVEHKVNTIFQLVQSHNRPRPVHAPPPRATAPHFNNMPPRPPAGMVNVGPEINMEMKKELIEVSDDDGSSFTNSSDESDTDSEDESVAPVKLEPVDVDIEVSTKKVDIGLNSEISSAPPQEINLDDDVDSLSDSSVSSASVKQEPKVDMVDYKKLTIPNLKKLAEERGFTNYKKLKKQGLVDLLSN